MSFVFNGVSSDTMKFNVTSRQVYNAPAYDLNAIEVPGRSGDLLNPQNRFKNKQITYTGFLKASDFEGSTWREKLSTGLIQLKGWLCSDAGTYHELTDDYDPGFIRYGYISGETAISDVQDRPFGVTLTVTFSVKPFMYRTGEAMELPETKSASGDIITITDGAENTPLKSCVVNIEPVQDLHGYANPWPGGGGKNLLDADGYTLSAPAGVNQTLVVDHPVYLEAGVAYTFSCRQTASAGSATRNRICVLPADSTSPLAYEATDIVTAHTHYVTYTPSTSGNYRPGYWAHTLGNAITLDQWQVEKGSSATSYEPYSNICPISGWSEVNVWVKPAYDTTLTPTATIPLGQTVYGGTLDVVRGKLTLTHAYFQVTTANLTNASYVAAASSATSYYYNLTNVLPSSSPGPSRLGDNEAWSDKYLPYDNLYSNRAVEGFTISGRYASLRVDASHVADTTGASLASYLGTVDIVYPLATPIEVDLTPQTIKTLLGVNNIWADAGEMSIEYPIPTENPYPFGSRPLYEITMAGTGTLVVNGKEWTITDYTGTLYCDTEAMEWYDASQLRNNIVSGGGWPVFEAGENSVSYTGDITKVMVTPRWRTL